jgi:homoserine dehydrogenase
METNQATAAKPSSAPVSNVAILGFGTVGSSVARILMNHPSGRFRLTHVYNRDYKRKKVDWISDEQVSWTDDFKKIIDSDVDMVVEVMGGLNPTRDFVAQALSAGKSVVTANKQLIAHHGTELMQLAAKHGKQLLFGASVAGGIPVLSGLQEGLAGDRLYKINGILNGTCNYILSQIEQVGMPFATALEHAQQLGFAEANASDDIDGFDARAKLAILSLMGLRTHVHPNQIPCHSIRKCEVVDFLYARDLACTIRQISRAEVKDHKLSASVQPALVPLDSPLARVSGSQNLVVATGEWGGDTVFSGHGAGGNPTAVAVVSDLIAIAEGRVSEGHCQPIADAAEVTGDFTAQHYLRFTVKDKPGILFELTRIFKEHDLNVDSVLQKPGYAKTALPFAVILEPCLASQVELALKDFDSLDFLVQSAVSMPMLG